jgi:hypothetical protein
MDSKGEHCPHRGTLHHTETAFLSPRIDFQLHHLVTVVQIGAMERAIEWATVEVSCEYRLSHGYDIISLGRSTIRTCNVIMTSSEHSGTV